MPAPERSVSTEEENDVPLFLRQRNPVCDTLQHILLGKYIFYFIEENPIMLRPLFLPLGLTDFARRKRTY